MDSATCSRQHKSRSAASSLLFPSCHRSPQTRVSAIGTNASVQQRRDANSHSSAIKNNNSRLLLSPDDMVAIVLSGSAMCLLNLNDGEIAPETQGNGCSGTRTEQSTGHFASAQPAPADRLQPQITQLCTEISGVPDASERHVSLLLLM